jgi:hypothetical protein
LETHEEGTLQQELLKMAKMIAAPPKKGRLWDSPKGKQHTPVEGTNDTGYFCRSSTSFETKF